MKFATLAMSVVAARHHHHHTEMVSLDDMAELNAMSDSKLVQSLQQTLQTAL